MSSSDLSNLRVETSGTIHGDGPECSHARHSANVGERGGKQYAIRPSARTGPCKRHGANPGHEPHYRWSPEHIDETFWSIDGMIVQMWAFIVIDVALYVITDSRGHEVPLEVLGKRPRDVDIHVRLRAIDTLAKRIENRPQRDR